MLLDETDGLGGRLRSERETLDGAPALAWVRAVAAELAELPETRVLTRTTGFGVYDGNLVGAVERVADHLAVPPPDRKSVRVGQECVSTCSSRWSPYH